MKLDKLESKIAGGVEELRSARERIRENTSLIDATEAELTKVRDQLVGLRQRIAALDSGTPADLHRRGITAAAAVTESDNLSKEAAAFSERQSAQEAKLGSARNNVTNDLKLIRGILPTLNYDVEILLKAQIGARLCAMIDGTRLDVLHELEKGRFDQLFRSTSAAAILQNRQLFVRNADSPEALIAVADAVLAQPIPALLCNPEELPDDKDSSLVRYIAEI